MTYIIAEPCIDIKDRSCVDVCPVDCIHEAERILVIDPEECIDCFAPEEQLLTSRGLRTFAELEGSWCQVLTDLFSDGRQVQTADAAGSETSEVVYSPEEEAAIQASLENLGYL